MKIALGSDGKTHLTDAVEAYLTTAGHAIELFGALSAQPSPWPSVAFEVAQRVASGKCDQAILFCWTGTGICIAANKVPGIRAALCQDAQTARGARQWNDANVLVFSLRATSEEVAKEILQEWFATSPSEQADDKKCLALIAEFESSSKIKL